MIETERLRLRPWIDRDRAPFHAMSQSSAVMRHLGGPLDRDQCDAAIVRMQASQASAGYCFWAVEQLNDGTFLGLCGLKQGMVGSIDGEIEIGWRLREDAWGLGYAREAASATLAWGWSQLAVPRIMAITVPANRASWGLMERLGMVRRRDLDFAHPAFEPGHRLHHHIVYEAVKPR